MSLIIAIFILLPFSMLSADDWNGWAYAANSSVQLSHAGRLVKNVTVHEDDVLLDVGCGDGKITAALAHLVPGGIAIGIDPSASMLAKATESFSEKNLVFMNAKAEDFSLPYRFDHIFSIHVMHWIKDQERALQNIYHHLKKGGQVHLILAASKAGLAFDRALGKTVQEWGENFADFVNPQQVYDIETYRKYLVNAGFHVTAIHYVYDEHLHESVNALQAWLYQWLAHPKHLPEDQRACFMDALINNYLIEMEISPDTNAPVIWGEYVLIAEGVKKT